jgi:myo-inositol 2-dehydrogenase / D-chiro-inositol 1-dehydrogenase
MATTPCNDPNTIERRDFIKKTSTVAGAIAAVGFPGIISGQTVTNVLKVGLIGCGGRGSGAAAQALNADPHAELSAVADIDEAIVERSVTRLRGSQRFGERVKIDHAYFGLEAYQQVIDSDVDVVLLATPPGFRPKHMTAAVNAGKHIFAEKPCATDSPGVREVLAAQKLAQTKNLSVVSGFCWRYNNMVQEAVERVQNGAIGRLVAHYSTYYTNPVKPMPPESERPAGMSDIEWQVRNWYNFVWTCGDSLVEQAVHNADKIMWLVRDEPPVSAVAVGGRAVPALGGNIYDHFEVNYLFPNGYRVFLANRQATGCYNATHDYVMGTEGTLLLGGGRPRIESPDGQVAWQFEGEEYDMYQREHDVLFAAIRSGQPKNDDLNLSTSTLLAIMGRQAAYTGQQVTWEQSMNSELRLVPDPISWDMAHPVPGLAVPGRDKTI